MLAPHRFPKSSIFSLDFLLGFLHLHDTLEESQSSTFVGTLKADIHYKCSILVSFFHTKHSSTKAFFYNVITAMHGCAKLIIKDLTLLLNQLSMKALGAKHYNYFQIASYM